MKKIGKIGAILLGLGLMTSTFGACNIGGQVVDSQEKPTNPDATVIYMSVYSGGFGSDWARKAAAQFNASQEEYFVSILPDNKDDMSTIRSKIESQTAQADVYMAGSELKAFVDHDLLMDVTDLYNENNGALKDKIVDLGDWDYSLKYGDKYYGLPHNDGLISAAYDHALFEEKGWLITDENGNISAGKDGKPGTYDDGQPVNLEEWDEMVQNILADGIYPFIYSGKFYFYTNYFCMNMWAQYTGLDNFKLNYTFNGDFYNVETKQTTTITTENGYKMMELDGGRRVGTQFAYDYLSNKLLVHPQSFLSSTHTEAQNFFVLGFKESANNPRSAILFDGIWWQNEARPIFSALEADNQTDYAYGKHDYRFLLAPNVEGSYGIDGTGKGSIITSNENCSIFAVKTDDAKKEAAVKAWMRYLTTDEVSALYTTTCGGVRPYEYSLTPEQYSSLNPFAKSVWDVYSDHENVKVIRTPLLIYSNEINTKPTTAVASPLSYTVNGITYSNFVEGLRRNLSVDQIVQGAKDRYSASVWAKMVSELN